MTNHIPSVRSQASPETDTLRHKRGNEETYSSAITSLAATNMVLEFVMDA